MRLDYLIIRLASQEFNLPKSSDSSNNKNENKQKSP